MIWLYSLILIGGIIASLGLPSRSGRMGSAGRTMLYIGLTIALIGIVLVFINAGWITAVISLVVAYLIPSFASQLRS